MNTKKHKNKNKPKPVNPSPTQKTEVTSSDKVEENIEDVVESQERVPEIISEVVAVEKPEEDTPKKPKRNRGKKKATDKEETEDIQKDQDKNVVLKDVESVKDSKSDESEIPKENIHTEVIPTARKKKNKNKKKDEPMSETQEITEIGKTTDAATMETKPADLEKTDTVTKCAETGEQETKTFKKKNKKKNRNDSEKSEDALAVTAAFQKLLEPREEKKDVKTVEKDDSKSKLLETPTMLDTQNITAEDDVKPCTEMESEIKPEHEEVKKGKKKNKKDKKHSESDEQTQKPVTDAKVEVKGDLSKVEPEKDTAAIQELLTIATPSLTIAPGFEELSSIPLVKESEKEKSPKPKPKIAKPVDKKRKGKADNQLEQDRTVTPENVKDNIIPTLNTKADIMLSVACATVIEPEITKPVEEIVREENKNIELETNVIAIDLTIKEECKPVDELDNLKATDAKVEKKRKKSPKPQKDAVAPISDILPQELKTTEKPVIVGKTEKLEVKENLPSAIEKCENIIVPRTKADKKRQKSKSPQPPQKTDIKLSDILGQKDTAESLKNKPVEDKTIVSESITAEVADIMDVPKVIEKAEETNIVPEKGDNIKVPETKVDKKRKKSPKPHKTEESKHEPGSVFLESILNVEQSKKQPAKEESVQSVTEITPEMVPIQVMFTDIKPEVIDIKVDDSIKVIEEKAPASDLKASTTTETPEKPQQKSKSEIQSVKSEQTETNKNKPEDFVIPETSKGSKRKKSPKPPQIIDTEPKKEFEVPIKDDKKIEEASKVATGNIETENIKRDDSQGSVCDIIPDVQYPRCFSEVDDNNNIMIQEVLIEQCKLNIPFSIPDTPLIQGSGETPAITPEVSCGITITEIDTQVLKPDEKTDLKSKVLEVNKDMEELRKSIERSLAELTAIEKSEEDFGKEIQQSKEVTTKKETAKQPDQAVVFVEKPEVAIEKSIEATDAGKDITGQPQTCSSTEPAKPPETNVPQGLESTAPIQPPRRENKGKNKKKKGKQEIDTATSTASSSQQTSTKETSQATKDESTGSKKDEKTEQKSDNTQEKGKQQADVLANDDNRSNSDNLVDIMRANYESIDAFEDALTSSGDADEVNKTFELIANENQAINLQQNVYEQINENNPEINITAPKEDEDTEKEKNEKFNPVSQPKNLIGHPDIPARLNKTDYKKEKNKPPNARQATVKIKDNVPIEERSKESQTCNKSKFNKGKYASETVKCMTTENEEYIYKYSFRKVFLPNACHVCKKELKLTRFPCSYCSLVFYCSPKHKDEDYAQHQALCFAVSTIMHLKNQKHLYSDAQNITGHNYRLLRMQMIISCEKVVKRRLTPSEQEMLLYPRICGDPGCREYRQGMLVDCGLCGQIAYCRDKPDHMPPSHQRWCRSYALYQKLVCYQQTKGRLEPKLPTRVLTECDQIPDKLNEVLASLYEEKIDMNDIEYAALTQIATAPLTAAYGYQLYCNKMNATNANGINKNPTFTIHVVGAELQFEADALHKWELFFLHLRPDVELLRVVLLGPDLNPGQLPVDLLGKIRLCENCRQNKRRVTFEFVDKMTYNEYWSTEFNIPDLVCAFNPSMHRSSIHNGNDPWPSTIRCVSKLKIPFIITSYTLPELHRDLSRVKECTEVMEVSAACVNPFGSLRPDRNFVSDDEMPLLMKNYCFSVVCGV